MSRKIYLPVLGIWEDVDDVTLLQDVPRVSSDGALINPLTGEAYSYTLDAAPRVSPLVYNARVNTFTAAASLDAANAVIGCLDTTPTAAECLLVQLNLEFAADDYVYGVEIAVSDTAGLVPKDVKFIAQPGDYVQASQALAGTSNAEPVTVATGTTVIVLFKDADGEKVYVTAGTLVWTARSGGSGYTGATVIVKGLSDA